MVVCLSARDSRGDDLEGARRDGGAGGGEEEEPVAARAARVLVIDDEPMLLRAIRRSVADECDVVVAAGGAEALAILEWDRGFDVVLCDLHMPDVSGIDLYHQLAEVGPELRDRTIFLTGGAVDDETRASLRSSGAPVLEKPPDVDRLRQILKTSSRGRPGGASC